MIMEHPEVLAKAQQEIDEVVGNDRLPTSEDRPSLTYLECIFSESLRWAAPIPLSNTSSWHFSLTNCSDMLSPDLPHRLMEDDVYRGMFMPKGSVVRDHFISNDHRPET
jgi:Cytochrome P450